MSNENIRKLVSFKTIEKILPIEGADRIELVKFGGWQSVVKKVNLLLATKSFILKSIHFCLKMCHNLHSCLSVVQRKF